MKRDAHYYAVLAFARAAGFNKRTACQIAHASQFVDDAKINQLSFIDPPLGVPTEDIHGMPGLLNMATCHSYTRMETFNFSAMMYNTTAFHFVPGCEGDGFVHKLRCVENSKVITAIVEEAMEFDDPIRLGAVLHPFADTFSHQHFSGLLSKLNDIRNCKPVGPVHLRAWDRARSFARQLFRAAADKVIDTFIPAYGHGQVDVYPDLPYLSWRYDYDACPRFTGRWLRRSVDNEARFRRAFEAIDAYLRRFLEKYPKYRDAGVVPVEKDVLMEALVAPGDDQEREQRWRLLMIERGLLDAADHDALYYDPDAWIASAFIDFDPDKYRWRVVENAHPTPAFASSEWYRFHAAVQWYKERFRAHCEANGLAIPL